MARLACVNVPALPLQLLLRERPEWSAHPVAVVADDRAQSPLLWVNAAARRKGVRTGMRHAAALSLCHGLRAADVPAATVVAEVRALTGHLHGHSPHVEPCREEPGVFWLDAAGLQRLHPDPLAWARAVVTEMAAAGLRATVVVGYTRFATHAAARVTRGVGVFSDAARERQAVRGVPLARLGLPPATRDALAQLAVHTVADLLRLPPVGLLERFGAPVYRLHRLAAGALTEGLEPVAEALPVRTEVLLDDPEADLARLLFLLKARLPALLGELGTRRQALKALHLRLLRAGAPPWETVLRPAAPTRDPALVLDLVRLRLEGGSRGRHGSRAVRQDDAPGVTPDLGAPLDTAITGLELLAEGDARELEQLPLFPLAEAQGLEAANRALARLRAEFGDAAVVRACLREGHLPEAAFSWEPLARLEVPGAGRKRGRDPTPSPPPGGPPVLVRRLFGEPRELALPAGAPGSADGRGAPRPEWARAFARALGGASPVRLHGPYPLSGGWWATAEHRDYYFAETPRGDLLWLFHDRARRRWCLHGWVE